jgi:hypothetical protein
MKNKIIRFMIKILFSFMGEKTRKDIFNKYEVMGDIYWKLKDKRNDYETDKIKDFIYNRVK